MEDDPVRQAIEILYVKYRAGILTAEQFVEACRYII